jgi:hypothetical protein
MRLNHQYLLHINYIEGMANQWQQMIMICLGWCLADWWKLRTAEQR